ncbi:MAG: hypothetical protein ACO1N7_01030 [Sphingobacteriaceae bacterium]
MIFYDHILIAANTADSVIKTLHNKAIHDFEDGLEYHSAMEQECACIITEDTNDFYFSDIEVLSSMEFCKKYLKASQTK